MTELGNLYHQALRRKHYKAAVLKEVTVPDEEAAHIYHTLTAQKSPYMRKHYVEKGIKHDAELPDDHTFTTENLTLVRRIDFLIFEGETIIAVEMKISKADFRRDTEEKRRAWKKVTNRFVYLTPAGLLTPADIPEGCGLWEYQTDGSIVVTKRAKTNNTPAPFPPSMIKYFAWRAYNAERATLPAAPRRPARRARRPRRRRY
jgi:hypothetical protein